MRFIGLIIFIMVSINCIAQEVLIPYRQGELWGYADTTGKVKISPKYDEVAYISYNNNYIVNKKGKYGLINSEGKLLTSISYDKITKGFRTDGYVTISNEKYGYISGNGEVIIKNKYDKIYAHTGALDLTLDNKKYKYTISEKKISKNTSIEKLEIEDADEDNLKPTKNKRISYNRVKKNGKEEIQIQTKITTYLPNNKKEILIEYDTTNYQFDKVIPYYFAGIKFALVQKQGKWGLFHNNQISIQIKYDEISNIPINNNCKEYFFKIRKDEKWYLIDLDGNLLLKNGYESINIPCLMDSTSTSCFEKENGFIVSVDKKYGIVGINDSIFVDFVCDTISYEKHHTKRFYTYNIGEKKGVYSKGFKMPAIIDITSVFHSITSIKKYKLLRIYDSENNFKGYVNQEGICFFSE